MDKEILLTAIIWLFTLIFFIFSCMKNRRVKLIPSLFIVVFVTFFTLFSPSGEVLLTIGSFKITLNSLLLGLRRSGILIGMVFLSRIVVNPNMKLHGKLGNKLTEVFFYLNLLTEKRIILKRGHIIEAIDERLCEIWDKETPNIH